MSQEEVAIEAGEDGSPPGISMGAPGSTAGSQLLRLPAERPVQVMYSQTLAKGPFTDRPGLESASTV